MFRDVSRMKSTILMENITDVMGVMALSRNLLGNETALNEGNSVNSRRYENLMTANVLAELYFNERLAMVTYGIIINIIIFLGVIGNAISLIVLLRKAIRTSTTSIYLRVLTVVDIFALLTAIFRYKTYKAFLNETGHDLTSDSIFHFDPYVEVYVEPWHLMALGISNFVTLALSFERFLAVRLPFSVRHTFTLACVRSMLVFLAIVVAVLTIPNFFTLDVHKAVFRNVTVVVARPTEFDIENNYRCNYNQFIVPIGWYIIPWLCSALFNLMLSYYAHRSSRVRVGVQTVSQYNRRLTVLVLSIVLVYMICNFPRCVVAFQRLMEDGLDVCRDTRNLTNMRARSSRVFEKIAEILNVLNNALNIIVYCVVGSKFRKELKRAFLPKSCQIRGSPRTVRTISHNTHDPNENKATSSTDQPRLHMISKNAKIHPLVVRDGSLP